MKDAIPVPHGFDPFPVPMSRQTQDPSRINAVRPREHFMYRTAVAQGPAMTEKQNTISTRTYRFKEPKLYCVKSEFMLLA